MSTALVSAIMIADDICEDVIGDTTKKHHRYITKQLVGGYSHLNIFHTPGFCVKTTTCKTQGVINYPDDCVYPTKIGLKKNGKVIMMHRDWNTDNIPSMEYKGASQYLTEQNNSTDNSLFTPFYDSQGGIVYQSYGEGIKCDSLYVVDRENRCIYLGSNWPKDCSVVMEYKTTGYTQNNLFPIEFTSTLKNWALWQYYLKRGDARYREYERYYKEERFKLEDLLNFQPIEYLASLFAQDRGTIKNYFNA